MCKALYCKNWGAYRNLTIDKEVLPKGSAVSELLLFCNDSSSFYSFSVLIRGNGKIISELKEKVPIVRDNLL